MYLDQRPRSDSLKVEVGSQAEDFEEVSTPYSLRFWFTVKSRSTSFFISAFQWLTQQWPCMLGRIKATRRVKAWYSLQRQGEVQTQDPWATERLRLRSRFIWNRLLHMIARKVYGTSPFSHILELERRTVISFALHLLASHFLQTFSKANSNLS